VSDGLERFSKVCHRRVSSLPTRPETVSAYIASRAHLHKTSTIQIRLVAIEKACKLRSVQNPLDDMQVKKTWRGVVRENGMHQAQKAPAFLKDLQKVCEAFESDLANLRDKRLSFLDFPVPCDVQSLWP
jgi:hypothetical protein